jgi:hypothetical protein
MSDSTRPPRRHPRAPILLLALAITTGWGDSSAGQPRFDATADVRGTPGGAKVASVDRADAFRSRSPGFTSVVHLGERAGAAFATSETVTREAPAKPKLVKPKVEKPRAEQPKVVKPRVEKPKAPKPLPSKPVYAGRNHFWIPSLGISKRVHLFECPRQRPPDNYMYRWGCAGENNVYIMGHAYSVMQPLHDAFVRGRLRVGMVAIYANGNGTVTRYRVTEWRVVDPVDSGWAIASQPVPSMTLQTCVGKGGKLRLNVRLVAVD